MKNLLLACVLSCGSVGFLPVLQTTNAIAAPSPASQWQKLRLGMSLKQVKVLMGKPVLVVHSGEFVILQYNLSVDPRHPAHEQIKLKAEKVVQIGGLAG